MTSLCLCLAILNLSLSRLGMFTLHLATMTTLIVTSLIYCIHHPDILKENFNMPFLVSSSRVRHGHGGVLSIDALSLKSGSDAGESAHNLKAPSLISVPHCTPRF